VKSNSLDLKILSDQFVKIDIAGENISPEATRRNGFHWERAAEFIENLEREKCDLPFVILFVIEIAVAAQTASGDAFNRGNFNHLPQGEEGAQRQVRENVVVVSLADGVKVRLKPAQRFGTISSSCGLCGKESIDAIRQNFPAIRSSAFRIEIETLLSLPEKLR